MTRNVHLASLGTRIVNRAGREGQRNAGHNRGLGFGPRFTDLKRAGQCQYSAAALSCGDLASGKRPAISEPVNLVSHRFGRIAAENEVRVQGVDGVFWSNRQRCRPQRLSDYQSP